MGELIKLPSQFQIRTKKQKIIKNKERIQKGTDNKRTGDNFSRSKWFPSSISNTTICPFHSNMEMWLPLLLSPYSIISTVT